MPEITPFPAIRFNPDRFGRDLSNLLAPPYDVLDQRDKDRLLDRSDRNIVAIDLPHTPPKSLGPHEAYERSARLLADWLADKTLIRDPSPSLYVYHQRFSHAGKTHVRAKFIARVRLAPFGRGDILPHEKTFGGPKEDRLALMKSTRCNLSAIFGLYDDPKREVNALFAPAIAREPDAFGSIDGVDNLLWVENDARRIADVRAAMSRRKIYIADGHHRYETALAYRDFVAAQHGGSLPAGHPADFVMFVLAGMDDPGCLILPYHRALAGVDVATILDAWRDGAAPAARDQTDLVLVDGKSGAEHSLRFTNRGVLASLEPNRSAAWRMLDVAYLHRYLIDELLRKKLGGDPVVRYEKSADDARRVAREERGAALLVSATPMAHLRGVSDSGDVMPQKSTYFHPRLATGLTLNPLT